MMQNRIININDTICTIIPSPPSAATELSPIDRQTSALSCLALDAVRFRIYIYIYILLTEKHLTQVGHRLSDNLHIKSVFVSTAANRTQKPMTPQTHTHTASGQTRRRAIISLPYIYTT